jgi:putative oxygen-independent coproporphyrinogen III oxidase
MTGLGLYVHFPWCVRKCPYCDFNSHPLRGELDEARYLDALLRDAGRELTPLARGSVATVFFGGGTPSLFSPASFRALLRSIAPWLADDAEITLEANPGTAEYHDPAEYLAAGINRLSFGAQSFDDRQLKRLGRIHHAEETRSAMRRARAAGFANINLDLMYGLPRQTVAAALDDLDAAFALEPDHVSWYQLTLEPKTEFAARPPRLPGPVAIGRMEAAGHTRLAAAGYVRYEVSAYARDAHRCRHNLNYWTFGDYVGIGAGAHGKRTLPGPDKLHVVRTAKAAQPRRYLGDPGATELRTVAKDQLVFEFLMNALRLVEGTDRATFACRTGLPPEALEPAWSAGVAAGLLQAGRLAATPLGYTHLDGVLQRFLA